MTSRESIETMCRRCINNEVCMGTGCAPKNTLLKLVEIDEKESLLKREKEYNPLNKEMQTSFIFGDSNTMYTGGDL